MNLKPFFRYYGGKWRAAPRYPVPVHDTIVEPFAGAAGYALRYPNRRVILVEKYPLLAEMWRYLIGVSAAEIRAIPEVEDVRDLPQGCAAPARALVGFWMNAATVAPCVTLSSGRRKLRAMGRQFEGWTLATRERIATQVEHIRHWRVIEGDYTAAPDVTATWFVDPPYDNKAGSHYKFHSLDYLALGTWCRGRKGQVLVCENEGADWLPFKTFGTFKAGVNGTGSKEVLWESK